MISQVWTSIRPAAKQARSKGESSLHASRTARKATRCKTRKPPPIRHQVHKSMPQNSIHTTPESASRAIRSGGFGRCGSHLLAPFGRHLVLGRAAARLPRAIGSERGPGFADYGTRESWPGEKRPRGVWSRTWRSKQPERILSLGRGHDVKVGLQVRRARRLPFVVRPGEA